MSVCVIIPKGRLRELKRREDRRFRRLVDGAIEESAEEITLQLTVRFGQRRCTCDIKSPQRTWHTSGCPLSKKGLAR